MAQDRLKVLLVDDDSDFLKVTQKALEQNHCIVHTARDQKTALSAVLNEMIPLAFIDCVLLSGAGTELVRQIRELLGKSMEIVLTSGIVSESSVENHLRQNACSFLKKPLRASDIERIVKKTKNKVLQGTDESALITYFEKKSSSERKLKQLFSLSKTDDLRFFLSLSGLFELDHAFSVGFNRPGRPRNTLFIEKGLAVDYVTEDRESFRTFLLENHILTEKEKPLLSGRNMAQNIRILFAKGFISPHQIIDIKTQLLFLGLKSLKGEKEIQVFVDFSEAPSGPLHITQNDFGDEVFSFLKDGSFADFQKTAERDLKSAALKRTKSRSYLPTVPVPKGLAEGVKFSEIRPSAGAPEEFYAGLFYLFLKGGISVTGASSSVKQEPVKERYLQLERVFKSKKPREIFQLLTGGGAKEINDEGLVIRAYHHFMSFNHIDKMPGGLSKDVIASINSVSSQIKEHRLTLTSKESYQEKAKKEAEQKALKLMETHRKQKLCQDFLEKENYTEGLKVLSTLPDETMNGELKCKLLYLWIAFQNPSAGTDEDKKSKFFHDINIVPAKERKSHLYLFVLGLFYAAQKNEDKAVKFFRNCQDYDPSFKPAHKALRAVLLAKRGSNTEKSKHGRKVRQDMKWNDIMKKPLFRKSG